MPDTGGRTPLSRAVQEGDDGAVKPLLEREGVNPHMSDKRGQTPLSWAASNWRGQPENVMKLLLEREEANPLMTENGGQTPLLWAASNL